MHKKMKKRRELEIRFWDLWGDLPPENPFRWWQPTSRTRWYDDLEADVAQCERRKYGTFDPGP